MSVKRFTSRSNPVLSARLRNLVGVRAEYVKGLEHRLQVRLIAPQVSLIPVLYRGFSCSPPVSSSMANTPKRKLPPGPSYIVSQILNWKTAGYISSVALIHVASGAVDIYIPVWAIVASSVIALPAALYLQSGLREWRDKRTAAALGARLAPKVTGKRPLGMDLIATLLEAHNTGYIGEL